MGFEVVMDMDITTLVVVAVYFIGLIAIGAFASKKIKNSEDFLVAGRNLGFWTFTLLVVSSICSGMTILGVAGLGYATGWPSIWEQIFVPLCAAVCILFFGSKLHAVAAKTGYVTMQDYFAHRFYSPRGIRGTSAIIGVFISIIYLVGQYISISMVLSWLFKIPYQWALVIGAVIVMGYTILGGLYAIGMASLIQGMMILLGVLLVGPAVIDAAGGLTHVNTVLAEMDVNMTHLWYPQVHPPYAGYAFMTPMYLVSFFFLLTFGLAAAPHVVNNVLAAREDRYFKWAPLAAFVIYAVIMYICKITGFAARSMAEEGMIAMPTGVSNPADYSFIVASEYVFPGIFAPLVAVIVLSAVMSTTDRLMLTIGSYVSWDIYRQFINKEGLGEVDHPAQPGGDSRLYGYHSVPGLVQSPGAIGLADLDGHRSDAGLLCNTAVRRAVLAAGHSGGGSGLDDPGTGGDVRLQLLCQVHRPHAHAPQHVRICHLSGSDDRGQPGHGQALEKAAG